MQNWLTLTEKTEIAAGTFAFRFKKPSGFVFKAGQFVRMTFNNLTYSFSIANSPFENNLLLVIRMSSSPFKQLLRKLTIGEKVSINGPFGAFVLPAKLSRPLVLLAGGIGIAPFHSMILEIIHKAHPKIHLIYSNRNRERAVFYDEFCKMAKNDQNFKFIPIITGEQGRIGNELLQKYLPDVTSLLYFLCGSDRFIFSMQRILSHLGVNSKNINSEGFG